MTQFGEPLEVRERLLSQLARESRAETYPVPFQGSEAVYLPVRKVRIGMPKYRVENGRTMAAQRQYVVSKDVDVDFFEAVRQEEDEVQKAQHELLVFFEAVRQEEDEVQKAQHELLVDMAKSGDTDLLVYFKKEHQNQPLILDDKGFVVNGNRRLAAMRELYQGDPDKFAHFSNVSIVVLPPCSPRDIDELEAKLQFVPEVKAEYSWIAKALTLQAKRHHYSVEQLAAIYKDSEQEIQRLLERLDLAEQYLRQRNQVGHYKRVERADQAFKQMQRASRKLNGAPAKQQFFQEVVYRMIDHPEGDRLYSSIPTAMVSLDSIAERLRDEGLAEEPEDVGDDDLQLFEDEGDQDEVVFRNATKTLQNLGTDEAERIKDIIQDCIEAQEEDERQRRTQSFVVKCVRDANTKLQSALSSLDDNQEVEGLGAQLDQLAAALADIRQWNTTRLENVDGG